jgi:hypothetical protein
VTEEACARRIECVASFLILAGRLVWEEKISLAVLTSFDLDQNSISIEITISGAAVPSELRVTNLDKSRDQSVPVTGTVGATAGRAQRQPLVSVLIKRLPDLTDRRIGPAL